MAQYESDNERKTKLIAQLERDQQQLMNENNVMSEQLYQLKSKAMQEQRSLIGITDQVADDFFGGVTADKGDLQKLAMEKAEKDKMVELLKRNHDVMMEKYEVFR